MERLHAVVHGLVQGVNFRYYTHRKARELGVTGWVRNLPDGTVETVAEADRHTLEAFLAFLYNGSPSAEVSRVDYAWLPAENSFAGFEVTH